MREFGIERESRYFTLTRKGCAMGRQKKAITKNLSVRHLLFSFILSPGSFGS